MTKKDDAGKEAPRSGEPAGPKKPYATLDLKATEVPPKDAGGSAGTATAKPDAAAASASSGPAAAEAAKSTGRSDPSSPTAAGAAGATAAGPAQASGAKSGAGKPDQAPAEMRTLGDGGTTGISSPPSARERRGGWGLLLSHAAAGVAGGALVLMGVELIRGSDTAAPVAQMQRRLAALEQSAKAPATPPELAQKLAAMEQRLGRVDELATQVSSAAETQAQLATETKALGEKIGTAPAPETEARLAQLEQRLQTLAALAESDPQAGRIPQLAALTGKVADLETTLENQIAAVRGGLTQEIESRLGALGESAEAAKAGTVRLDRDVAALKTDTARLAQRMEALKADNERSAEALRAVQEETGALRSGLDGLKGDVNAKLQSLAKPADIAAAVAPVNDKMAALEERVRSVASAEDERKVNAERIVLALELANLKRVIDRGQPYAAELAEVKQAAAGRIDLAALERHKGEGVASLADLQREFRPVANAMIDAEGLPADGSVMDRLLAGAKSVVRVRKVSHGADDASVEAILGRMETALEDGRLGDVLAEAKALPPKSAAAGREWLAKVEGRHAAAQAIAAVEAQLKSSLAGVPASEPAAPQQQKNAAPGPDKSQQ